MSDDAKEEQAASAPAGDGFTPAPPPPAMSEEEAAAAAVSTGDTVLPDGTIAVPQDTAKRALEAVQILVENNRSASQQLESLMGIVLDAAEVANRSASAVATTGTHVNKAAEKLIDGAKKTSMQAKVVLALAAAVLVGTAGTFSFMTVQLHGKVEQLDEMLLAVGKRAVDLKRRMETMDDIHASLEELNLKQENTQSVQQAIEDKIARLVDSGKLPTRKETSAAPAEAPAPAPAPAKPAPQQKSEKSAKPEQKAERADKSDAAGTTPSTSTAKAVSPKKSAPVKSAADEAALLQQLGGLDSLIKEQSRAMRELSSQVNNLQGSVATVDVIKKDVESIAAQQKQREKEAAQREKEAAQELAAANARREKEVTDQERELARERDRARERDALREREVAREREAAREREVARERDLARERELAKEREKNKDKDRAVSYNREQSKPNAAASVDGVPSYAKPASKTE